MWIAIATALTAVTLVAADKLVNGAGRRPSDDAVTLTPFPIEGPYHYKVEYLGITCGHMTLESRLEEKEGRPGYHDVMTARTTKFFNKSYRADGQTG